MSSINTISTFGAPSGALISKRGGGVTLRAFELGDRRIARLRDRQHRAVESRRLG